MQHRPPRLRLDEELLAAPDRLGDVLAELHADLDHRREDDSATAPAGAGAAAVAAVR